MNFKQKKPGTVTGLQDPSLEKRGGEISPENFK
jgi:hypothetical protein